MNLIKQKDPKATNTVNSTHSKIHSKIAVTYTTHYLEKQKNTRLIQDWLLKLYKSMYLTLRAKLVSELKSMLSGSLFHAFKTCSLKK